MSPYVRSGQGPAGLHREKYSSRKIFFLLLVCCGGILYLIWLRCGGTAVPCLFHSLTGIECPGCGITRMLLALTRLDLRTALSANAFLFVTLPYLVILLGYSTDKWVRNEKAGPKAEASAAVYCIGLIVFGILRNIS